MSLTPADARKAFDAYHAANCTNHFSADPHLQSLLAHYGREGLADELGRFGAIAATKLDPLARETNRDEHLPKLRRYDGFGHRQEAVDFHPGYHEMGRLLYAAKPMSRYAKPGQEFASLCIEYLFSQNGEAGHACPMACTAGMIKILQRHPGKTPDAWMERLLDPNYDTHYHAAQFLTEVQGGSDVGANAVEAHPRDDGTYSLVGEKWFCSVIDAHLFLVTARPAGETDGTRGVKAFVVPRNLEDGRVNDFNIRRLKFKLGTRSMASAEVDFKGAQAWLVADFKDTVQVVLNTSRLYNAVCSAASLERSWREASAYAHTRQAFGQPIARFPTVARILAHLRTQAYAARSLTFYLMDLSDRLATGAAGDKEAQAFRMLVNFNKFWTAQASSRACLDAIEVLGGNGAIEEFSVLPRLLRDAVVCEAWEGGHNVLCAQALRDSKRLGLHKAMFDVLDELGVGAEGIGRAKALWARLLDMPDGKAMTHMRDVAEAMRAPIQAAFLLAEAQREGSDPSLPVIAEHLLTVTSPGWDPLEDEGLSARIGAIVVSPLE